MFRKLHETGEWQDALRLNGWSDAFQVGAKYRLRRALQISDGSLIGLVNSLMAIVVYAIIAVLLAWPLLRMLTRKRTAARERAGA